MIIKPRAFPWPVLGPEMDDYLEGSLEISVTGTPGNSDYRLFCNLELDSNEIKTALGDGRALIGVVVECKQNLFRKRYPANISDSGFEILIPADTLTGEVQILAIVTAAADLDDFAPANLNEDYTGIRLSVPKNAILAFSETVRFEATPFTDRLKNVSSIMRVRPVDKQGDFMDIQKGSDRIIIEVSRKNYRLYRHIVGTRAATHLISGLLVQPVLLDVLHEINQHSFAERKDFGDRKWFRILRNQLAKHNIDLENHQINPMSCCRKLLESPFGRSIRELGSLLDMDQD